MSTAKIIIYVVLCILAYFIGAINFAIIIAKKGAKVDIKQVGSGNPGTMNVLRTVGKKWGALTFACDALKGLIFGLVGRLAFNEHGMALAFGLGLCAIVGHIFSVYTKFKGGKGVATSIGFFMSIIPIITSIVLAILIIWLFYGKYGFVGSLTAIGVLAVSSCIIYRQSLAVIIISLVIFALVVYAHRGNIKRLATGKENTLQLAKKSHSTANQPKPSAKLEDETTKQNNTNSDENSSNNTSENNQENTNNQVKE